MPGNSMAHTPFKVVMYYLLGSILIFWIGPINWRLSNAFTLGLFHAFMVGAIALGYFSANTRVWRPLTSFSLQPFFKFGVYMTLLLQIPLTLTYTNKYPWDVVQAVMNQGLTYGEMLEQIASQQGTRFYVPLLRSISMPFFFAALVYGVLNFKALNKLDRFLLLLLVLCPINLSLLRGTDKEIFDLVIVIGALGLIYIGRLSLVNGSNVKVVARRMRRLTFLAVIVAIAIFFLFTDRKLQRMSSLNEICFVDGLICTDYSGPVMSAMPEFVRFGVSVLTFYLTHGYYGLSLALDQSWSFAHGIGHSAALQSLYERVTNDSLQGVTYVSKAAAVGWDERYYWVSIFPWIASDVGFAGSLVVIAIIARLFHQSWKDATRSVNDTAAIVFVLLCLLFFYLPANNQLTQTFDSYFAFVAAIIAWKLLGKPARLS